MDDKIDGGGEYIPGIQYNRLTDEKCEQVKLSYVNESDASPLSTEEESSSASAHLMRRLDENKSTMGDVWKKT